MIYRDTYKVYLILLIIILNQTDVVAIEAVLLAP